MQKLCSGLLLGKAIDVKEAIENDQREYMLKKKEGIFHHFPLQFGNETRRFWSKIRSKDNTISLTYLSDQA